MAVPSFSMTGANICSYLANETEVFCSIHNTKRHSLNSSPLPSPFLFGSAPYLLLSCEGGIFWAWNEEAAPKGTLIQRGYNSDNNLGQFKWHVGVGLNK